MEKKLKIAIDVSPLSNGNSVRGVGYYTKNLAAALQSEVKNNPKFRNIDISLITQKQSLIDFDLVHYPYFDPFFLTLPAKTQQPRIITIHDLIPRQFKSHFPVGLKGELFWQIQKYLAKKSNSLITVSNFSKSIIANILKYPAGQIYVTYEAADSSFKQIKEPKILNSIKNKYQLPDKFVLYVGDINWNKNVPGLVKACLKLKYPIVIVGSAATSKVSNHPWTQDILWLQSQKSSLITLTGFIPDIDLPAIFNLATICCLPSFAEGFGLPAVEAMQTGTPVVYSQETSLPEIMENNGEAFDPYKPDSLQLALKNVWNNISLQEKYRQLGLKRSSAFSWQNTAIQTLTVYQHALDYGK